MGKETELDNLGSERWEMELSGKVKSERTAPTDFVDHHETGLTNHRTYSVEIKNYIDPDHPRRSDKFNNYMIDYDKLLHLEYAKNDTKLLACYFYDKLVVWDINKVDWKSTKAIRRVNKKGVAYGQETETAVVAYLKIIDAVYTRDIDDEERDYWHTRYRECCRRYS